MAELLRGQVYGQYGDCRRLGHAWFDAPSDWKATIGTPMTMRCERCGSERHDQVGVNTGEIVSRSYKYPDGYQYARDERPTSNDFRRMFLEQMMRRTRKRRNAA